jgi:ATP-dependent exoDNAse (exonuclease V) beta subunit
VGPLLVIAGAGSGKTNTLAHRVAHLIVNGADPGRILLLTFSPPTAEMERRAQHLIARRKVRKPASAPLVRHVPRLGARPDAPPASASIRLHHPRPGGLAAVMNWWHTSACRTKASVSAEGTAG